MQNNIMACLFGFKDPRDAVNNRELALVQTSIMIDP